VTRRADEPLASLIAGAFRRVCKAEELIDAGGGNRADKQAVIDAHSALLKLRNRYPVRP
jgi:hypothetical protein